MKKIVALLMIIAVSSAAVADTHTWVGGTSAGGGWNTASNWKNEAGEYECPSAGDIAKFNQYQETNVVNDADFELFNSMSRIEMASWSYYYNYGATLVLDVTKDVQISPAIRGSGKFIKRGTNRAEFMSTDITGAVKDYSTYGVYYLVGGGIIVEAGTLMLIQDSSRIYFYNTMWVNANATLSISTNQTVCIVQLWGDGTVINEGTKEQNLQISYPWSAPDSYTPDFAGKLTGPVKPYVYGRQIFSGTESDNNTDALAIYGEGTARYAWIYAKRLGLKGTPSSLGTGSYISLMYGANFGYIGDGTPDFTDRSIEVEARTETGLYPQYIDAGTNGNLTLSKIQYTTYGSSYKMRSLVFTGSNAAPCTVNGPYNVRAKNSSDTFAYNFYTRKEGPGVWRFRHNANSTFEGVFDVREGTLRFDTIAEQGVVCALGKSTALTEEFTGAYDSSYDSIYAFRVGKSRTDANAADSIFEFDGITSCSCSTRPLLLTGDAHLRANGEKGAALQFADVRAQSGETTLVIDGTNTDENVLSELKNGDGTVSLVKEGTGSWSLSGNQTFTGDLKVKSGKLTVKTRPIYTWFRFISYDGYGSSYTGYLNELALYDADGNRQNLDLAFNLPSGKNWTNTFYPSGTYHLGLLPGEACFSRETNSSGDLGYYLYEDYPLSKLFDGSTTYAIFSAGMLRVNALVMRLTNTTEIVSVDIDQNDGNYNKAGYQTTSAFRLEGSTDGVSWKTLVDTNNLPKVSSSYWYFSEPRQTISAYGRAARKLSDGQGLAFTNPARSTETYSMLTGVRSYSVDAGAELVRTGNDTLTISNLKIDASAGIGTIKGFNFATSLAVEVTNVPQFGGMTTTIPADFSGVGNFDEVETITITPPASGKASRYTYRLTSSGLVITKPGMVITVR